MTTIDWFIENYPAEAGRKMLEIGINPIFLAELIDRDFISKEKIKDAIKNESSWHCKQKMEEHFKEVLK